MKMPNFIIIGAARTGTTSLYYYLQQHEDIFMSPCKEPGFFAFEGQTELIEPSGRRTLPPHSTIWEEYLKLFEKATIEKAVGEASTLYLYHHEAPERIRSRVPDAKLIAILRNPVERALSHYLYNSSRSLEPCSSLNEALMVEEDRIANAFSPAFHYRRRGLYAEQLNRYLNLFPKEQLLIFLHEDLIAHSLSAVQEIFQFVGVDSEFIPDMSVIYNPSGKRRLSFMSRVHKSKSFLKSAAKRVIPQSLRMSVVQWEKWRNVSPIEKPEVPSELRKELIEYYRDDVLRLQKMIRRDLSHWLEMEG